MSLGSRPFRFNNCWVKQEDFMRFVKVEWDSLSVNERGDYILKKKLKALKGRLKWWNRCFWMDGFKGRGSCYKFE